MNTRVADFCQFTINGKLHTVDSSVPFEMSLNTYLREVCNLRGTKYMCQEGGCGTCVVSLTVQDSTTDKSRTIAVNSCLLPVFSCSGKSVTTVEGLGSKKTGYSLEQRTLADFNGSQCGYCSPGMVMNMHSLLADKKVTMAEVENSFGGNICRCTGYRPILYAFKSLASDAPPDLRCKCLDIETGTLAGNLSIKHQHREFPSDIFLTMETVGAKLEIGSSRSSIQTVTLPEFLDMEMDRKVMLSLNLPPLDSSYVVRTYKIMPRAQNAHAYVNAGFCFKLNRKNRGQVLERPRIVFGGINPAFIHAVRTEEYLQGKQLFNENVLKAALHTLNSELTPDHVLPDASPEYRKGLALALFYKFVLSLRPQGLKTSLVSGGELLTRGLSSGRQKYQTDHSEWPVNKPVIKLEAHRQTSGEAQYVDDMPTISGELFASFVLAKEGPGTIAKIDTSAALAVPGVVSFYAADDIPGKNNYTLFSPELYDMPDAEEIFSSGKVLFAGQPVGVIVATTQEVARAAADMVIVNITDLQKPVLTIEDAIASGDKSRFKEEVKPTSINNTSAGGGIMDLMTSWWSSAEAATHVLKGNFHVNTQYHFTMETQTCVCVPVEDGIDVYSSTQWMDLVNCSVSECLNIPENSINIFVRRMGGAYGCKVSRAAQVACACALAAYKLNRPVRLTMSIEHNMEAMGKRFPGLVEYEVHCDSKGKITSLKADMFENNGINFNETSLSSHTVTAIKSGYNASKWLISGTGVRTDIPSNTMTRAPGSFEGTAFVEAIMEHIAQELDLDPIQVRLTNMDPEETNIPRLMQELRTSSNFDKRKQAVENFNKENRWKKRGISFTIMKFPIISFGGFYSLVSIYHQDGTVSVCHGGLECGQGINTKVAQVAAKFLGIDLDMVKVKPSNNLTAPNSMATGGSIASESCAYATMMCCQELLKRLEPVRKSLHEPTWKELVGKAYEENIDMCASYMSNGTDIKPYSVEGAAVAEVEVDVLTGQMIVQRVDILENAGKSLSPEVDIGQVEGAFIMGMGCFTSEEIILDPDTGRLLTNRTWNYKPPGARDIPVEFNVELQGNSPNPVGVLRSKTTGEPAVCLSCSVFFAIKNALSSARKDAGLTEKHFEMDAPATVEKTFLFCKTNYEQFSL
ncbi:uncharacterized protein [Anabrus simplex]|uniref:uncharacterized protein isoform X2 n=1 Tax=Anabrus simplex TaxID=316456 RepID=UPI0035A3C8D4